MRRPSTWANRVKITLEELLAFTAVVDSGSVTAAADRLGQTTSGVSRALSRLEAKLDATLLRRTTRRLSLTEEGQSFWRLRAKSCVRWIRPKN